MSWGFPSKNGHFHEVFTWFNGLTMIQPKWQYRAIHGICPELLLSRKGWWAPENGDFDAMSGVLFEGKARNGYGDGYPSCWNYVTWGCLKVSVKIRAAKVTKVGCLAKMEVYWPGWWFHVFFKFNPGMMIPTSICQGWNHPVSWNLHPSPCSRPAKKLGNARFSIYSV